MKRFSCIAVGIAALLLAWSPTAQTVIKSGETKLKVTHETDLPQAVVVSVHGKSSFAADGKTFIELKSGQVISQGAIVRTADGSRADLFLRRLGTSVRLQENTEVFFEKMARHNKEALPVMETLLHLRSGRIFTVVRSLVPGSTLEIRNEAGRSIVEGGGGKGRYIITADGTHVTDKDSAVPLKVAGETGITIIKPGHKFNAREGKVFAIDAPPEVDQMIAFDEIQSLTEQLMPTGALVSQDDSEALVLAVDGKSTYNQNGESFKTLRVGQVLTQGSVVRSGENSIVDLFLRRWGTTVRLMRGTELSLEKMTRDANVAAPAMKTLLDLREGRIFCFIRIPVPGSSFQVKTKAGRSVLESEGAGRYDIRADGTIITGKGSFKHLQFITEKGIVMISPGQKFTPEDGHMTPAAPSEVEVLMMEIDQLASLAEQLTIEEAGKPNVVIQ